MINTRFASIKPEIPVEPTSPVDTNPLRRLDRYIDNYEPSFERMAKARNAIRSNDCRVQRFDHILACPERISSKPLRALVYLSKYLEELGEAVTDLSGWIERASRNTLSGGNKNDIAQVLGSGLGRIISGFASTPGIAVHKVAGACLVFQHLQVGLLWSELLHLVPSAGCLPNTVLSTRVDISKPRFIRK